MDEDEKENDQLYDLGVAICPLRSKQCLQGQCAWWLADSGKCAITKMALQK
jgi:hypothetical protein